MFSCKSGVKVGTSEVQTFVPKRGNKQSPDGVAGKAQLCSVERAALGAYSSPALGDTEYGEVADIKVISLVWPVFRGAAEKRLDGVHFLSSTLQLLVGLIPQ